jgi:hypothetical protein
VHSVGGGKSTTRMSLPAEAVFIVGKFDRIPIADLTP